MKKTLLNKVTIVTSPIEQSGKTTIANNLAYLFTKKGYVTCVIELNRYIGTSPYLNDNIDKDKDKSLKTAIEGNDETLILRNFIQSSHNEALFTLSLRISNDLSDLYKYNKEQLEKIVKIAVNKFDKVFIDVPMNYLDNGFIASINSSPEQTILIMDNNIVNWHKLKLYDLFFKQIKYSFPKVTCIINKDEDMITDSFIKEIVSSFEMIKINNFYKMPFMKYIIKANNEGILFSDLIPSNKKERTLSKTFDSIIEDIEGSREVKKKFFSKKITKR
ncbi:MAG: hypothetical protein M0Q88_05970 [Bacilli bacterium]|nr:hypothetical protein [Bacilli bacterium]